MFTENFESNKNPHKVLWESYLLLLWVYQITNIYTNKIYQTIPHFSLYAVIKHNTKNLVIRQSYQQIYSFVVLIDKTCLIIMNSEHSKKKN